jgi:hypothetical protein
VTLVAAGTPNLDYRPPAADLFSRLKRMGPERRAEIYRAMSQEERARLISMIDERKANPYFTFRDDPVAFVTSPTGLDEVAWSLQREIMLSVLQYKRTAVPACHAPGKSHIAARIIAWWGSVHPAGTARILTTANTFRQVRNVLWPYIRQVHAAHGLPGEMNMVEWYIGKGATRELVAEGIKPPDDSEAALSGLHAPHQLIVVDEAGGISHAFGRNLLGLLTGSHVRLLIIGNPPIDDEGSWFEKQCERTDLYNVIPIPWDRTPNATKEDVGLCKSHPSLDPHPVTDHLIDASYVDELTREYGDGSAVVLARVHAKFPKTNESRTLPIMWLERAQAERDENGNLVDDDGEVIEAPHTGEITLGADIAGGLSDELVIAAIDTGWATLRYAQISPDHKDPQNVVGIVAAQARWAAEQHRARGITSKVRCKVDSLGLGWNIYGQLKALETDPDPERRISGVDFIEVKAGDNALEPERYANVRAEMWWLMRRMIEPDKFGRQQIVLDVDTKTMAQLNAPKFKFDSRGHILIESKDDMLKRGIKSPDRADAILMAAYEPKAIHEIPSVGPVIIGGGAGVNGYRATGSLSEGGAGQSDFVGFAPA